MTKAEKLQLHRIMENLDCDEETAKEIMETDKRIDKGEKLFDLPKELEKGAKKARMSGNCKGYTKSVDKEKKIDVVKRFLIQSMGEIAENLADNGTIEIANPEREFTFVYKDKKYKIVLSCPRS
jgi:hypothetical protein